MKEKKQNSAEALCSALRCAIVEANKLSALSNEDDAVEMCAIQDEINALIRRVNAIRQAGTKPGKNAFWSEYLERWVTVPQDSE